LFINPRPGERLKCTLFVRIDRTGTVQDVQVVESSGNAAFDRQAEIAVRKASPLPLPGTDNPKVLDLILQGFNFVFVPEG
jgi:colicin import membrane protein